MDTERLHYCREYDTSELNILRNIADPIWAQIAKSKLEKHFFKLKNRNKIHVIIFAMLNRIYTIIHNFATTVGSLLSKYLIPGGVDYPLNMPSEAIFRIFSQFIVSSRSLHFLATNIMAHVQYVCKILFNLLQI